MSEQITFDQFGLHEQIMESIASMGYRTPTAVQTLAIPEVLAGKDLVACAQTGTGKTAAYLLPTLNKILSIKGGHSKCLILVPTRELAKQIDDIMQGLGYFCNISSLAVYGGGKGDDWDQQKRALTTGSDIIIATPGRLIAHLLMGYVKLDKIHTLILDEADKMLDMGFYEDILRIIQDIPAKRQTLMFSATMPPKIRKLANQILDQNPAQINLSISKPPDTIDQQAYLAYDNQKIPLLQHIFAKHDIESTIIFTSRKSSVTDIERALRKLHFKARGISSDRTQEERESLMRDFRNKKFNVLVATDILSRGIDIEDISHIFNFDVPQDAEDYVHRIGRTARAKSSGTAITFINEKDQRYFQNIELLIEKDIPKTTIPEDIGKGPEYNPSAKKEGFFKGGDKNKRKFHKKK